MNRRHNSPMQQHIQELLQQSQPSFLSRPVAWEHTFYLQGQVESPENYVEWFDTIRNASLNDHIMIHINSFGGNYATALQFRRVLMETEAMVTCSIEGECHSAATIVYLSADAFSVSEGSSMLCHDYQGIAAGTGSSMYRQIQHEKLSIDAFLTEIYNGFLTEDEIENMLQGQDLWLTADEICERTEALIELRTAEAEEAMQEDDEHPEEPAEEETPKPRRIRKKDQ